MNARTKLNAALTLTILNLLSATVPQALTFAPFTGEPFPSNHSALAAEKVNLDSYMKKVSDKIGPLWNPPKTEAKKLTVKFTINANGSVADLAVAEPTGDKALEEQALALIKKAAPFAALPPGMPKLTVSFGLPTQRGVTASGVNMQSYYDDMWKHIQAGWWVPKRLLFIRVPLKIVINKDGSLNAVSLIKSSGDANADKLALVGVRRAAPFAPLPEGVEAPFTVNYTIGYDGSKDHFVIWNGQKVNMGDSYTSAGGVKTTLTDTTTEKDKQFHLRKENALIKMSELDDVIAAKEKQGGSENQELAPILLEYAKQHQSIEEQKQALEKLRRALKICEAAPEKKAELLRCLVVVGEMEYSLGNLKEAETLLTRAIAMKEEAIKVNPSEKDADYKSLLNTYARLLYKQSRQKEADEQYKKIKELG